MLWDASGVVGFASSLSLLLILTSHVISSQPKQKSFHDGDRKPNPQKLKNLDEARKIKQRGTFSMTGNRQSLQEAKHAMYRPQRAAIEKVQDIVGEE